MIADDTDVAWDAVKRVYLPNLSANAYVSDTDKATLTNIQKIPFLPQVVRKFHEMALDRIAYAQNSAESVRCGPKQFKTIHNMLREACSVMSITEPEIYIKQSEVFNAYTSGTNRTFIVLHSALVDHFTDDELLFVIGHECGHIKAGHVLYQELGRMLIPLIEALGQATMGLGQLAGLGLVAAFYEWMRQAEISCDRAGLLVSQNPRGSLAGLMKLGGVSVRLQHEADLDTFLEQARNHAASGGLEGLSKAFLFVMYNWQLTHPQVVYRAKALDEWITQGKYQKVIDGDYPRDMMGATQLGQLVKCPNCKKQVSAGLAFCPNCGQDLHPERNGGNANVGSECVQCHTQLAPGTKFCPVCGTPANQGGYQQQQQYPPQQAYYPPQGGYPPPPPGYGPPPGGYPPQQGGYPPPQQGAYPPQQQQGYGPPPNGYPAQGSYEAQTVFPPQPDYPMQQQPSIEPPPVVTPPPAQNSNSVLENAKKGVDAAADGITSAFNSAFGAIHPSKPPQQQYQQQQAPQYQPPAAPPPAQYQAQQQPPMPPGPAQQTPWYQETAQTGAQNGPPPLSPTDTENDYAVESQPKTVKADEEK